MEELTDLSVFPCFAHRNDFVSHKWVKFRKLEFSWHVHPFIIPKLTSRCPFCIWTTVNSLKSFRIFRFSLHQNFLSSCCLAIFHLDRASPKCITLFYCFIVFPGLLIWLLYNLTGLTTHSGPLSTGLVVSRRQVGEWMHIFAVTLWTRSSLVAPSRSPYYGFIGDNNASR